jgi:hypothetical protein
MRGNAPCPAHQHATQPVSRKLRESPRESLSETHSPRRWLAHNELPSHLDRKGVLVPLLIYLHVHRDLPAKESCAPHRALRSLPGQRFTGQLKPRVQYAC